MLYYTTTISPIVEEIVKALPVLIYAFAVSSDRDRLISISFAVGLGFAIPVLTYIPILYFWIGRRNARTK